MAANRPAPSKTHAPTNQPATCGQTPEECLRECGGPPCAEWTALHEEARFGARLAQLVKQRGE